MLVRRKHSSLIVQSVSEEDKFYIKLTPQSLESFQTVLKVKNNKINIL
jgi:hypothetical protein